jgi:hypothetical protein
MGCRGNTRLVQLSSLSVHRALAVNEVTFLTRVAGFKRRSPHASRRIGVARPRREFWPREQCARRAGTSARQRRQARITVGDFLRWPSWAPRSSARLRFYPGQATKGEKGPALIAALRHGAQPGSRVAQRRAGGARGGGGTRGAAAVRSRGDDCHRNCRSDREPKDDLKHERFDYLGSSIRRSGSSSPFGRTKHVLISASLRRGNGSLSSSTSA